MRKIFLENLPHKNNKVDWGKSKEYKVHFIYDDIEGNIEILDYNTKIGKLKIKYNNQEFDMYINGFRNCTLGKIVGKVTSDFKIKIGTTFKDDKRDIIITNMEYRKDKNNNNRKWYKYKCNKCGWTEGWIEEKSLNKNGCSCCYGRTVVQGINDIPTTNPEMVKFFQGGYDEAKLYTYGSDKKIYPVCPECGRIKNKLTPICKIYQWNGIGCKCSDGKSYAEKFAFNILEQLKIDFETEYSPKWITPKRYDFYIPSLNIIIETDGGFHSNDNTKNGQTKEESKVIDNYKDAIAKQHNIQVIRIDCNYGRMENRFEYIKQNIVNDDRLNKLFDLSKIDWNQCEEFALSNRVKEACELWNSNDYNNIKDISNIMKLSYSTIIKYLNQGYQIKWCTYIGKEERQKILSENHINRTKNSKKIFCITTKQLFISVNELIKQSEELFGIKFYQSDISEVCNSKRKHISGYQFKYISDLTSEEYI